MLVLTRKKGERIVFPSLNVAITLLDIHGGRVRLGIEAPVDVKVHREELLLRLQSEGMRDEG